MNPAGSKRFTLGVKRDLPIVVCCCCEIQERENTPEAFSKNSTFVSREIASIFYDTCVKPLAREFCVARGFRPLATQSTKLLINLSREEILSRERFSTSRERFPIGADFLLNASELS